MKDLKTKINMKYTKLMKFIKTWNEGIGFILSLAIFIVSPYLLRWWDPASGSFDTGVIQVAIVALMLFQFCGIVAWFTFRLNFPKMHRWFDDVMEEDLLTGCKYEPTRYRTMVSLAIYFFYFLVMTSIVIGFIAMDVTY